MAITLNSGAPSHSFLQMMLAEAESIQQFVEILTLEQASLSQGNTDDLPAFAEKKSRLALQLNNLAAKRNALLAAQGLNADRAGVEAWCAKHPQEMDTANIWAGILSLVREARELNRLNGELIQIRMQYNAKALEALQGGRSSLDLYGPDGQSTALSSRRINDAV